MKKLIALMMTLTLLTACAAFAEDEAAYTVYPPQKAHATFTLPVASDEAWTAFLVKDGVATLIAPEGTLVANEDEEGQEANQAYVFEVEAENEGETVLLFNQGGLGEEIRTLAYLLRVSETGELFVEDLTHIAPLHGKVTSVDAENRTVLIDSETHGEVMVRFPEGLELPVQDEEIEVWFNGVMTMSLPGQINAIAWETVAPDQAR